MPKKPDLSNPFARTEPASRGEVDSTDLDEGRITATGVGLTTGEVMAIAAIAATHGISRNALMRFAIRWFIKQVKAGAVDLAAYVEIPAEPKKHMRMP